MRYGDRVFDAVLGLLAGAAFMYEFAKVPAPPAPDLSLLPIPCASERHLPGNPFVIPCPCQ